MNKPYFGEFGRGKRKVRTAPHHSYGFRRTTFAKSNSYANTIFIYQGSLPFATAKSKFPKIWASHILGNLAGAKGIEPLSAVLETDILPLNYAPVSTVVLPAFVYAATPDSLAQHSIPEQKCKHKSANIIRF